MKLVCKFWSLGRNVLILIVITLVLAFGSYPVMLRGCSWLHAHELLLVGSGTRWDYGDWTWVGSMQARQVPYPLYSLQPSSLLSFTCAFACLFMSVCEHIYILLGLENPEPHACKAMNRISDPCLNVFLLMFFCRKSISLYFNGSDNIVHLSNLSKNTIHLVVLVIAAKFMKVFYFH